MPSRLRSQATPGISFFSFQDIITSVTAILLLISLMLALELTRPAGASSGVDADLVREKRENFARLTEERDELDKALDSGKAKLDAQTAVDPSQIDRQIGETDLAVDRQHRSNQGLARELAKAESERRRTEAARSERVTDGVGRMPEPGQSGELPLKPRARR